MRRVSDLCHTAHIAAMVSDPSGLTPIKSRGDRSNGVRPRGSDTDLSQTRNQDGCYAFSIFSMPPIYGRNASGIMTLPSAC